MQAPVVVSAKDASRLFDTPANAYIFDEEAINHLPVDSIPELLRYAPGVHIMRPSNGNWGIGIHGMNSQAFGRVPLMVDNQNIYGSIFSGLVGSQHDVLFGDLAAVEVIYGPGGMHWNNNGGNGAVNIVMKTAFETQGSYGKVRVGSEGHRVEGRTGWAIDEASAMRVSGSYSEREPASGPAVGNDRWQTARAGVRWDKRWTSEDLLSVTADLRGARQGYTHYWPSGDADMMTARPDPQAGKREEVALDVQGKWLRQISEDEEFTIRGWSTLSKLDGFFVDYDFIVMGLDARSRTRFESGLEWIFAAGISGAHVEMRDSYSFRFTEARATDVVLHIGSEWTLPLIEDRLDLTVGLLGQYESMGDNFEPTTSLRLLYKPTERDRFWLSYMRSARPMNLLVAYGGDVRAGFFDIPPFEPFPGAGIIDRGHVFVPYNADISNEKIQSFEAGYRRKFLENGEAGITVFYNKYEDLFGGAFDGAELRNLFDPFATPYVETRTRRDNIADADTMGLDTYIQWEFTPRVSATLTYSYLQTAYTHTVTPMDPDDSMEAEINRSAFETLSEGSPRHLGSLWIAAELNESWRVDVGLRYSDAFGPEPEQEAIFQMDARLTWNYSEALRLSLVGRNLLSATTDETRLTDYFAAGTEQRREWYLEVTYRF